MWGEGLTATGRHVNAIKHQRPRNACFFCGNECWCFPWHVQCAQELELVQCTHSNLQQAYVLQGGRGEMNSASPLSVSNGPRTIL